MESHDEFVRKLEESRDGHFLLEERNGRAILQVFAAGNAGKPVKPSAIFARLELFGLEGYDREMVQAIAEDGDEEPHDICPWKSPESVDAEIDVLIANDAMTVELEIRPPSYQGKLADMGDVLAALERAEVVHGIDHDSIEGLLKSHVGDPGEASGRKKNRRVVRGIAARGTQVQGAQAGRIRYAFDPRPRPRPTPGEKETDPVDFKTLGVIQTCAAGDLLAELQSAVEGKPGTNVFGQPVESDAPTNAKLVAGRNTRSSPDGQSLYSTIAGQVRIDQDHVSHSGRVDVEEVLTLESVDYSTGHIDFPGTVVMKETILDGFKVKAQGDIIVDKSIGDVELRAEGDIVLAGGIVGRGGASIQTPGDVLARFIQNATVYAGGSIIVEEAAMHARLTAGNDILVQGGRGELIGGTALSGRLVRVELLGARNETETIVTVGLSPELMEQLRELEDEFIEKRATLEKVELHLAQIDEAEKRGNLKDGQAETREKLQSIRENYRRLLDGLEVQREAVSARVSPNAEAAVEAESGVHPGTEIRFGAGVRTYRVDNRPVYAYCRFVLEEGRIALRHSQL